MRSRILLWFLLLGGALPVSTQTQGSATPQPCTQPQARQFDFWVGEWNLTWPAANGQPSGKGTNSISKILDACVIEENFKDLGAAPALRGLSVSTFNGRLGKWQQTWVDSQGSYLDFTGEWNGKEMILSRQGVDAKGEKVWQRMVWKNISANALDWSWERSNDGTQWEVVWPIHYERAK